METRKSRIIQWLEREEKKNNWFVILVTQPSVYLNSLIRRTIMMGVFLFALYEILTSFDITHEAMPTTFHGIVGLVIGLLLVFRTNTAYDRWWEARKLFGSIHAAFILVRTNLGDNSGDSLISSLKKMNNHMFKFLSESELNLSDETRDEFLKEYISIMKFVKSEKLSLNVERKMMDIMEHFCSLERIKDTPIPLSYSLHIKLSLFAYLTILPFSLFFGMGIWAIPLVMVLFFIIAGIEIISNEIENPFRGDPNDLPMESLRLENEKAIDG
ncbi:MAG TPA: bestrophin family ion channel [Candidatus Paceibacterota bacterium]|nr:bestrophin family ion channel [Candidatus Paceibacterota bacterium]